MNPLKRFEQAQQAARRDLRLLAEGLEADMQEFARRERLWGTPLAKPKRRALVRKVNRTGCR